MIFEKTGGQKMIEKMIATVSKTDKEIADAIQAEYDRQSDGLELIASENVVSEAVLCAMGSVLTNKYAEGYPGKRYYGGCSCVDVAETIAIERAKKLFGAKFANVQPHSGAQANTAVYFALLQPGDTVMGMSLAHGGHLTHGSPALSPPNPLYPFQKLSGNYIFCIRKNCNCFGCKITQKLCRNYQKFNECEVSHNIDYVKSKEPF